MDSYHWVCTFVYLFIYLFSCSYRLDAQPRSIEKPKAMPNISKIFCSIILTPDIYAWIRVVWCCSQSPLRWPDIWWKLHLRAWCISKLFCKFATLVTSMWVKWFWLRRRCCSFPNQRSYILRSSLSPTKRRAARPYQRVAIRTRCYQTG